MPRSSRALSKEKELRTKEADEFDRLQRLNMVYQSLSAGIIVGLGLS